MTKNLTQFETDSFRRHLTWFETPGRLPCPWLVLCCCLAGTATPAYAAATSIYKTGFEAAEGYDASKELGGQNGWVDSDFSGHGIVTNFFDSSVQQAYIGYNVQTNAQGDYQVYHPIDFQPLSNHLAVVTFSTRLAIFPSSTTNQDDFRWSVYTSDGDRLLSIDFDGVDHTVNYAGQDGDFQHLTVSYDERTIYRLVITMNFARNTWSAYLESTPVALSQPLTTRGSTLSLGHISARWVPRSNGLQGDDYMVFDDYEITVETDPLEPENLIFATSFEQNEGYFYGSKLVGQNGWRGAGSGGNGIVTNFFDGQAQSAFLGFAAPTNLTEPNIVVRELNYSPAPNLPSQTKVSATISIYDSTSTNHDAFIWTIPNSAGKTLTALQFDTADHAISFIGSDHNLHVTGITFRSEAVYRLAMVLDLAGGRWSAALDSTLLLTNQPVVTSDTPLDAKAVGILWQIPKNSLPGDDFIVFDDLRITAEIAGQGGLSLRLTLASAHGPALIRVTGEPGTSYTIESSPDFKTWKSVRTVSSADGISDFLDDQAASASQRFYRARKTP